MKTPEEIKKGLEYCTLDPFVCKCCPYHEYVGLGCSRLRNADALALIQQLEDQFRGLTKMVPKWISVKDGLPEVPKNYNWVEVLCLWQIPEINYVSYRVMRYYANGNCLSMPQGWSLHGDPLDRVTDWSANLTHWMPLPTPPEASKEG